MSTVFVILSGITIVGAVAAMSMRNLVHCALCLIVAFAGLAALYLGLGAQFVGFAQILVYIGAVAILIVFAILLTKNSEPDVGRKSVSRAWSGIAGVAVAFLVFAALSISILSSSVSKRVSPNRPEVSVKEIGEQLMAQYVLPLEVIALVLTSALIGSVLIAMPEKQSSPEVKR